MNKIYLSFLFISLNLIAFGQISIGTGDMPSADDSIRMSSALNTPLYNFAQTDTNYTWDFSQLTPISQRVEKYVGKSDFPLLYLATFFSKANLGSVRDDVNLLSVITIENGYNFFKNKSSYFKQVGYGAEINGVPTPIVFSASDYIYRFPMAYGNSDSCISKWSINIPSIGSLKETKNRVNHIDGWGTVITPYGTFQCIRIKSEIKQMDSITYSTGGITMGIPQNYTEYTWFSKSIPFPIIKVISSLGGTQTSIEYSDSARQFVGIEASVNEDMNVKVFPNPSTNGFTVSVQTQSQNNKIQIMDLSGRVVYNEAISNSFSRNYPKDFLAKGVYILRLSSDDRFITKKIVIQ